MVLFDQEKSNGSNQGGGPTQRASALAALNSAFNSSPGIKPVATSRPSGGAGAGGQGSQRAAAVAALSQVLTAEKKSPDVSPARSARSPLTEASPPGTKNFIPSPPLSVSVCVVQL